MNALIDYMIKSWYFVVGLFDISLVTGMGVTLLQAQASHETISEVLTTPGNVFLVYGGCLILLIRIVAGVIDLIIKYNKLKTKDKIEE
jgi:hypothetical protein